MKIVPMKVTLVDHMGSDLSVVNAARVSFDKESHWEEYTPDGPELSQKDSKLISYLATHNHFTPFCHAFTTFRIKAPLFVARQLGKHQVGLSWNEVSRRYVDSEPEFYMPEQWRKKAENVKQGSSNEPVALNFVRGVCGYCSKEYTPKSPNQKFCHVNCQAAAYREAHPYETKWTHWKNSAKARGLEFSIEKDDIGWVKHCPYLGFELDYKSTNRADNGASLDRIDSTKGYVKGNVQIISLKANLLKNDATKDELVGFARNVLLIHAGVIASKKSGVEELYEQCLDMYNTALAQGVAPEQTRILLPQATMTEWVWSGSLFAFARVCNLRLDPHAQKECRDVAQMINDEMQKLFPVSWAALVKGSE